MRGNTGDNMTPEQREAFNAYHRKYAARRKELAEAVLKARLAKTTLKHAEMVVIVEAIPEDEPIEEPSQEIRTHRCLECGAELPEGHHPVDYCDWKEYRAHFKREYAAVEVPALPACERRRR